MNFFEQITQLTKLQERKSLVLRFDPVLENEYVEWIKARQELLAYIVIMLMCTLWFIFLVADFWRLGLRQETYREMTMFALVLSIRIPIFWYLPVLRFRHGRKQAFIALGL